MRGTWPRPSSAISRSSHPSTFPSIDPSSTPSFTSSRPLPPTRSTRSSPSSTFRPAISSKPQPEKPLIRVTDGFAELGRFDKDGNGMIDGNDPVFNSLILLHADGGMTRLRDESVTGIRLDLAIPLNPTADQRLAGGVAVKQSEFSRADGSRGTLAGVLFDVKI